MKFTLSAADTAAGCLLIYRTVVQTAIKYRLVMETGRGGGVRETLALYVLNVYGTRVKRLKVKKKSGRFTSFGF